MKEKVYDLTTVKGRLLTYLKEKRLSQVEFAESMGVTKSYIGAMRKSLPSEKIRRIEELYPDLNTRWLLYGEGEMKNHVEECACGESDYQVPLLPVSAFAGNLQMWSKGVASYECMPVQSPVKGGDYAIPICGDSMEPDFQDGATLVIKRINDRAFIPWGSPMVIDTVNGVLFKDVYPATGDDTFIEARSRNPNYPSFRIPKDSILGMYRVLCSLKLFPIL